MGNLLQTLTEYSWLISLVAAVVGAIFTILVAALAYFYQRSESKRDEEITAMGVNLKANASAAAEAHAELSDAVASIRDAIGEFRGDLKLTSNQLTFTTNGLTKLEGKIELLADRMASTTNELARSGSRLDAVFRIIDPPTRLSDRQG